MAYEFAATLLSIYLLREILEILDARQLRQVFQSELDQKLFRRAVHHRASHGLFSALRHDQPFLEQGLDGRGGSDAANFEYFGDRNRLLIGDYSERFERGQRESRRRARLQIFAYELVILGASGDSPAPRNFASFKPAPARFV